jgi:hypothetical protein
MISECCGAEGADLSYNNLGLCPICKEGSVFISEEEFGEREQIENALGDDDEL